MAPSLLPLYSPLSLTDSLSIPPPSLSLTDSLPLSPSLSLSSLQGFDETTILAANGNATIMEADVYTCQGIVEVVDKVLLPPSVVEVLGAGESFLFSSSLWLLTCFSLSLLRSKRDRWELERRCDWRSPRCRRWRLRGRRRRRIR